MWDFGSLKKGLDRCWVNWAWFIVAYLDRYMKQYIYIYIYWLSKREKQQVHSIKMSNDDYECFKKVIFD